MKPNPKPTKHSLKRLNLQENQYFYTQSHWDSVAKSNAILKTL